MLVAAVQHDIEWEDKAANHRTVDRMLDEAGLPRGAFVVLPELGDTGFSFDLDRVVDDDTLPWARETARRRGIWLQVGWARRGPEGRGRNCAAIVTPGGEVGGVYEKVHPFTFGKEADYYDGGERILVEPIASDASRTTIGLAVCYDLRFPELFRHAALAGAEILAYGANWPDARQAHWRALSIARAIENQAVVVAVNRVGTDPNLAYAGGSIIVGHDGRVLAEAAGEPDVIAAEIDLPALRDWRRAFPALRDVRNGMLGAFPVDAVVDSTAPGPGTA